MFADGVLDNGYIDLSSLISDVLQCYNAILVVLSMMLMPFDMHMKIMII